MWRSLDPGAADARLLKHSEPHDAVDGRTVAAGVAREHEEARGQREHPAARASLCCVFLV